jgi:murein hydrolase activator
LRQKKNNQQGFYLKLTDLFKALFKRRFKGCSLGLILLFSSTINFSLVPAPVQAQTQVNDKAEVEQALGQLQQDIKKLQRSLKSKQKQQSEAITSLRTAEKQIATTTKILRSTQRQLSRKEGELKTSQKQQRNLESTKSQQKKALAQQIKSSFINGRQEYLKMLLNQEDPEALGRMLVYFEYMNKARSEKVAQLQKTLVDLDNIEQKIQQEINTLNILKKSKQEETIRLSKLKEQRKSLVANLGKEIANKNEQLTELQVNAAELQQLIDSVQETIDKIEFTQPLDGLKSKRGKMKWPTKGRRTKSFGSQLSGGMRSNGVLIQAQEGTSVNAIHYGRIVYADWLRGFGLLVIIDHGEGYMSLYGYNQALYKQVGDWVESGEPVATVGLSGGQQQAGLYFELRHQGKPFNPAKWLR